LEFVVDHLRVAQAARTAAHKALAIARQQSCRFLDRAICPVRMQEGPKAMAGSPDAEQAPQLRCGDDSLSPSCSWLSPFRENHERQIQCSILIVCNLTGVAANSR
jgi:hypothetical protein